jgi:hypothetical protein
MVVNADDLLEKPDDGGESLFESLDEQKTEESRVIRE